MFKKRKTLAELKKIIEEKNTATKTNEEEPFSPDHTETVTADPITAAETVTDEDDSSSDAELHDGGELNDDGESESEIPKADTKNQIKPPPPPSPPIPTSVIRRIRGRIRQPEKWKQSIRKRLRESGQEYVNAAGKTVKPRQIRAACTASCYQKCTGKFSEEQRKRIHDAFWLLTDEQKNYFYWKYTARVEPKRRRKRAVAVTIKQSSSADEAEEKPETVTTTVTSRRGFTIIYRFEVKGEMHTVCSVFFFGTLDITSRRVSYFYEHNYDPETCMPRPGQQPYARTTPRKQSNVRDLGPRLEVLRAHIASFPSTRYSGSTKKRYLAADLSITRMYKMYAESTADPLKQHWYNKVFNEEFYLGFRGVQAEERRMAKLAKKKEQNLLASVATVEKPRIDNAGSQPQQQVAVASIQSPQTGEVCIPAASTVAQPLEYPVQYTNYSWLNGFETYNHNNYQ